MDAPKPPVWPYLGLDTATDSLLTRLLPPLPPGGFRFGLPGVGGGGAVMGGNSMHLSLVVSFASPKLIVPSYSSEMTLVIVPGHEQ